MRTRETLLFDVNETLLDLRALRPHFAHIFGDEQVLGAWFAQLLRHSLVATITRRYAPFHELGRDALAIVARGRGIGLASDDGERILGQMLSLPAHSDVVPALERLRSAGYRMATLTNSAHRAMRSQLTYAGLLDYFDATYSVEAVQLFKPAAETYRYAARELGVPLEHLRMIAAHNWDTTGAIRAGARAAFVARPGMSLGDLDEQPDVVAPDLLGVVAALLGD